MINWIKKYPFQFFLSLHFIAWSLLPLLRKSLPMDTIEAVAWGRYCTFGTNKHPPLSGWLAHIFYDFIGFEEPIALYALSQVCVIIGFIYIYRLGREFLSKDRAVFAAMLLSGVIYYGFSAIEYNVNVVSLALWPMCAFYFYRALDKNTLSCWLLTGFFAACNLFNKYTSGVLIMAMGILMLYNPKARKSFLSYKPYLGAILCCVVFSVHAVWLYQHQFFSLSYFIGRGSQASFENMPVLRHIIYPAKFLAAQALFALAAFIIYFTASKGQKRFQVKASRFQRDFALIMGAMPVFVMAAVSCLFGLKLKSMWGFPCFYMLGILLFVFFPCKLTSVFKKKMYIGIYTVLFILLFAQTMVILFNKSEKFHLDAFQYGQTLEKLWRQENSFAPLEYVAGEVFWADTAALFAPSKPKPIIWGDTKQNPWFNAHDVAQKGALVVATSLGEYEQMRGKLKFVSNPKTFDITVQNRLGKTKKKTLYWGIYNVYGENK